MSENKVQFGLKNVYYSILTEGSTNAWATPVALPGAVSLSLDKNGDASDFYADNVTYYRSVANNGYTGSLEVAKIPDSMLEAIWGMSIEATTNVLFEKNEAEPVPFALLFEIDGDADQERYCFYRCLAERPSIVGATTTDTKEPQTQALNIACLPIVTGSAAQQGLVRSKTTATTPAGTKSGWFSSVIVPVSTT